MAKNVYNGDNVNIFNNKAVDLIQEKMKLDTQYLLGRIDYDTYSKRYDKLESRKDKLVDEISGEMTKE